LSNLINTTAAVDYYLHHLHHHCMYLLDYNLL